MFGVVHDKWEFVYSDSLPGRGWRQYSNRTESRLKSIQGAVLNRYNGGYPLASAKIPEEVKIVFGL